MLNRFRLALALVAFSILAIYPQANLFTGRTDFTVTTDRDTFPQWMEVIEKDGSLQARIQPRGGAVRPFSSATVEGSQLLVTLSPARDNRPATIWNLTANGDKLTGIQKTGEAVSAQLAALRAPELKRPMPAQWTTPEPIFNGKDLSG